MKNFEELQDVTRQIENLAYLLRSAAETGNLHDSGEDVVEDTARIIQEKARDLGQMLQQVKDFEA